MANILYGVNGEGSGHSSRAHEVLKHLQAGGHTVHVVSFDRGRKNLSANFEVTDIFGLRLAYAKNRVRYGRTVLRNLFKVPKAARSMRRLQKLAAQWKIQLVITDFEPLSCLVGHQMRLPVISIDNQHVLVCGEISYPRGYRREAAVARMVTRLMTPRADAHDLAGGHTGGTAPIAGAEILLDRSQLLTIGVISVWVVAVVGFRVNVGLAAFGAATILALARAADESAAVKRMPWGIIIMVSGISVLIGVLEKSGGMELFAALLAKLATPATINGSIAFITGLISTWSSTSGVVLPAFLPTVPSLVSQVGGGDPLAVALSINVGSSLVDVSPLSTLGALCVAAVVDPPESRRLFRQLMIWGLSMSVVGAVLCQLLAGVLARA